mmetsp:Transcript_36032/g.44770  ORF Transcript_36032/g.44770 Transcript_36032/m.44770 type:complete len:226 (+) Transcript_36032:1480-2157(+)
MRKPFFLRFFALIFSNVHIELWTMLLGSMAISTTCPFSAFTESSKLFSFISLFPVFSFSVSVLFSSPRTDIDKSAILVSKSKSFVFSGYTLISAQRARAALFKIEGLASARCIKAISASKPLAPCTASIQSTASPSSIKYISAHVTFQSKDSLACSRVNIFTRAEQALVRRLRYSTCLVSKVFEEGESLLSRLRFVSVFSFSDCAIKSRSLFCFSFSIFACRFTI